MKKYITPISLILVIVIAFPVFAEPIKTGAKAVKKGAKAALLDVPNKVGGAVSVGFDSVGRFIDNLGEKDKVQKKKENDPLPLTEYPQDRQF